MLTEDDFDEREDPPFGEILMSVDEREQNLHTIHMMRLSGICKLFNGERIFTCLDRIILDLNRPSSVPSYTFAETYTMLQAWKEGFEPVMKYEENHTPSFWARSLRIMY
jgi:hypothetical protein